MDLLFLTSVSIKPTRSPLLATWWRSSGTAAGVTLPSSCRTLLSSQTALQSTWVTSSWSHQRFPKWSTQTRSSQSPVRPSSCGHWARCSHTAVPLCLPNRVGGLLPHKSHVTQTSWWCRCGQTWSVLLACNRGHVSEANTQPLSTLTFQATMNTVIMGSFVF